jgi:hypothetical protein
MASKVKQEAASDSESQQVQMVKDLAEGIDGVSLQEKEE